MLALAKRHPSVAIVQAYRLQGDAVAGSGLPFPSTVVSGRDSCRIWLTESCSGLRIFGHPTSLMYRSDIVRGTDAFFNESNLHADTEACLQHLQQNDYGFVHQVLSFIRVRPESMTSYSRHMETDLPRRLYHLAKYGPIYLTRVEQRDCTREVEKRYYRYLARQVYSRRGSDFWTFHRNELAGLGQSLSYGRLYRQVVAIALDVALNPRARFQRLSR